MWVTRRHAALGLLTLGLLLGLLLSPANALDHIHALLASPWFPVLLVGLYIVRPFLAWPITAVSLLVGYRYGLMVGLPVALIGAVGTSMIPYGVGRYVQSPHGWIGWVAAGSERFFTVTGDLRGLIAVRLAPTPAEPVSAAAGMAGIPLSVFVLGTAVGELPWTLAAVIAGHSMHQFTLSAATPDAWLVLGGLLAGLVLIAGPAYRYVHRRISAEQAQPGNR